jgi:hypothetical protein
VPDEISATGWLVILCALALGFGVVKFMISNQTDHAESRRNERGADDPADGPDRHDDTRI